MRDVHFDGAFLRDFNRASENWSWATWHQIKAEEVATARRLLAQVFETPDAGAHHPYDAHDEASE